MVSQPVQGAEREGLKGFFGGMARGVVGALTAPVTGTLSAFSKVRGSSGWVDVAAGWLVWGWYEKCAPYRLCLKRGTSHGAKTFI